MSSPTWYDLLGVSRDATPAQIKAAWRDATDKFEPGSGAGQFRLFNEAADVLLDPARRAAYDAELGGVAEAPAVEPAVQEPAAVEPAVAAPAIEEPADVPVVAPPEPDAAPSGLYAAVTSRLALAILAVLATASVILGVVLFSTSTLQEQADIFAARPEAQAVATRALNAALSYNYQRLETDKKTALSYMTPRLATSYSKSYTYSAEPSKDSPATALARKVVVQASVLATGVISASATEVKLLVFVDQQVLDIDGGPTSRENRVVATLVRRDGRWLLDKLEDRGTDYPAGAPTPVVPSAVPTPTTVPTPSATPTSK